MHFVARATCTRCTQVRHFKHCARFRPFCLPCTVLQSVIRFPTTLTLTLTLTATATWGAFVQLARSNLAVRHCAWSRLDEHDATGRRAQLQAEVSRRSRRNYCQLSPLLSCCYSSAHVRRIISSLCYFTMNHDELLTSLEPANRGSPVCISTRMHPSDHMSMAMS